MAGLQKLIKLMEDVGSGGKLSASTVEKAKELSEECYEPPQSLTSAILRAHLKSVGKAAVSSFYIFDALARHAQDNARKTGRTQKPSDELAAKAAAWLSNAEGIIEEIISSTLKQVPAAYQEKVRKVVVLWRKAELFSEPMMQIVDLLLGTTAEVRSPPGRGASPAAASTSYGPSSNPPSSSTNHQVNAQPAGLPPELAALLGSSAPSATLQPPAAVAPKSADQLLSSLTSLISDGAESSTSGRSPMAQRTMQPAVPAHPAVTSFREEYRSPAERSGAASSNYPDVAPIGGSNGAMPHGNGYGSMPQHQQHNAYPPYPPPNSRSDAPRSVSPVRGGAGRRGSPSSGRRKSPSAGRRGSQSLEKGPRAQPASAPYAQAGPGQLGPQGHIAAASQPDKSVGDLSQFDPSTFDPTDPGCLERLAKMYHNTYNYYPSMPEMMCCVMMLTASMSGMDPSMGFGSNVAGAAGARAGDNSWGWQGQGQQGQGHAGANGW